MGNGALDALRSSLHKGQRGERANHISKQREQNGWPHRVLRTSATSTRFSRQMGHIASSVFPGTFGATSSIDTADNGLGCARRI